MIKTDSALDSEELIDVTFHKQDRYPTGGIRILFNDTLKYQLLLCNDNIYKVFQKTLPTAKENIWKITIDKTADIRVIVHCNREKVLDTLLSDDTCSDLKWRYYWSENVQAIKFNKRDTASDYYLLEEPEGKLTQNIYL